MTETQALHKPRKKTIARQLLEAKRQTVIATIDLKEFRPIAGQGNEKSYRLFVKAFKLVQRGGDDGTYLVARLRDLLDSFDKRGELTKGELENYLHYIAEEAHLMLDNPLAAGYVRYTWQLKEAESWILENWFRQLLNFYYPDAGENFPILIERYMDNIPRLFGYIAKQARLAKREFRKETKDQLILIDNREFKTVQGEQKYELQISFGARHGFRHVSLDIMGNVRDGVPVLEMTWDWNTGAGKPLPEFAAEAIIGSARLHHRAHTYKHNHVEVKLIGEEV